MLERRKHIVINISGRNYDGMVAIKNKKMKRKHSRNYSVFLSVLIGFIIAGLFSFGTYVLADPPTSAYSPGATLNPSCTVGSTNCTVTSPVPYSGASSAVDLGSQTFTTTGTVTGGAATFTATSGAQASLRYNSTNYASFTTASNGDLTIATTSSTTGGQINLNSAITGDATILSSSGALILGGSGATNNEKLKFDFETYANKVAFTSSTGVTDLDFGSLNLATTGTLTLGGSTTGTLVTRVKAGAASESDANGALVVDSTNGRLYFRYGSAWHYVAQTAGFQIPAFEAVDPISGEQIKEGDVVLGLINQTFEDNALHGVWVKWDSVKEDLLKEIKAGGEISLTESVVSGSSNAVVAEGSGTLLDSVKNVLLSLGISITNGITYVTNLATESFQAKVARVEQLEMIDRSSGDVWCTWLEGGEWRKTKGECGSVEVAVTDFNISQQNTEIIQQAADAAAQQAATEATEQVQENIQEQITAEVQEQVQVEVQEQIETQVQEQIQTEVQEQVQTEVQTQLESQQPEVQQQETLFDIFTIPQISRRNSLTIAVWLILIVLLVLFAFYRIDRRRMLKKIEEIKLIKELPNDFHDFKRN